MNKFGALLRNAGITFLGALVSGLLGYLFRLLVARIAVEEYGLYNLGLTALNLLFVIGSVGLLTGVTRFTAAYIGTNERQEVARVFTTAVSITVPLSIVLSVTVFALAPWLAVRFHDPGLAPIFRLAAFLLPITMLQEIFLAITDGLKRMSVRVGLIDILQNVVKILAMLLFLQVAPGATVAFGALGLATLVSCLVAGLQASRLVPLRLQFPLDRSLLRYSYPLLFAKFISMLYGWTDTLVIGLMMTARDVGVYNAALPTAMLLLIPSQCILSIYLPLIAELVSRNEREDIRVIHHRVTRWIVLLSLPATLFQIAFSREIVTALFGEPYGQAGPALAVLAVGFLIQAASKPSATLLHAFKETRRVPMITLGSLALNLALNILLVREVGIVGAAVATGLTSIATGVAYWTMTRRLVRLHWGELGLLKPLGAAALATGGVMYVMTWIGHSLPALIAAAAAMMGGYVMLLWLSQGFDRVDLTVLLQAINKLGIDSPALERLAIGPDDPVR